MTATIFSPRRRTASARSRRDDLQPEAPDGIREIEAEMRAEGAS
jgi:hypothetical protein